MEDQRRVEDPRARRRGVASLKLPLDIVGEVRALIADEAVVVTAAARTIAVDVPNIRTALKAFRGAGGKRQRAQAMTAFDTALQIADLTVEFRLAGGTVARLGAAARPGLLSRLPGLGPLEIRLSGLLALVRAIWR